MQICNFSLCYFSFLRHKSHENEWNRWKKVQFENCTLIRKWEPFKPNAQVITNVELHETTSLNAASAAINGSIVDDQGAVITNRAKNVQEWSECTAIAMVKSCTLARYSNKLFLVIIASEWAYVSEGKAT